MFYWKPTKLKIIISIIPLIIIFISDLILDVSLIIFGSSAGIPKVTIYAMKIIPFFPQIKKFAHLFSFSLDDIYPPVISFKILSIALIDDLLIGLTYFVLIYLIYSLVQYYNSNQKIK